MEEKAKVGYTLGELVIMLVVVFLVGFGAGALVHWSVSKKSISKSEPAKTEQPNIEPIKTESALEVGDKFGEDNTVLVYVHSNFLPIAGYYYYLDGYYRYFTRLSYKNIHNEDVWVTMHKKSRIIVWINVSGVEYNCSDSKNGNICKEAGKAVVYWQSIMEWDERVKRILEEQAKQKPEEKLY